MSCGTGDVERSLRWACGTLALRSLSPNLLPRPLWPVPTEGAKIHQLRHQLAGGSEDKHASCPESLLRSQARGEGGELGGREGGCRQWAKPVINRLVCGPSLPLPHTSPHQLGLLLPCHPSFLPKFWRHAEPSCSPAGWCPWASHLISVGLSFPLCQPGVITPMS